MQRRSFIGTLLALPLAQFGKLIATAAPTISTGTGPSALSGVVAKSMRVTYQGYTLEIHHPTEFVDVEGIYPASERVSHTITKTISLDKSGNTVYVVKVNGVLK